MTNCNTNVKECEPGFIVYNGLCVTSCPIGSYYLNNSGMSTCRMCHYTCANCSGPNDYECTLCFGDAILKEDHSQLFCYPRAVLPLIENSKWFFYMFLAFSVNVFLLIAVLVYFAISKLCKRCRSKESFPYSKVRNGVSIPNDIICDMSDSDGDNT